MKHSRVIPLLGGAAIVAIWTLSGASAQGAITLTADTNRPEISTSALGQAVQFTFQASGMSAGQSLSLQLNIVNEHGSTIETRSIPVLANGSGAWQSTITAPDGQLGFYRVNAQLSNGVTLSPLGSRPAGALTYAVVPDPAQRVDYGEKNSFFGLQGGFGASWGQSAQQYLGARWTLDSSFNWSDNEPNYAGQWNGQVTPAPSQTWTTYSLPTLFMAPPWAVIPDTSIYCTGALTPAGETAWSNYCAKAANAFRTKYPNREQDIYQITWEPIQDWGFKGTDEQLLRIYQIAYGAIHTADPKAVVAGPTMGITAEGGWPGNYERETQSVTLFQKGLAKYLDAYTTHPYYAATPTASSPEAEQMVDRIRYIRSVVSQYGAAEGKTLPLFGTEQGYQDDGTPAGELKAARYLIRENLIMMGEGFRFNFGFYAVDASMDGGATIGRYGYYYSLVNGIPWGPNKVCPKPIVPAYAAQSLLLDGHRSGAALEDMGGTKWGYRFDAIDGSNSVFALWDYGAAPSSFTLCTGLGSVLVYDWMGNSQWMLTNNGALTLTLGEEPVYVMTPVVPEPSGCAFLLLAAGRIALRRRPATRTDA